MVRNHVLKILVLDSSVSSDESCPGLKDDSMYNSASKPNDSNLSKNKKSLKPVAKKPDPQNSDSSDSSEESDNSTVSVS